MNANTRIKSALLAIAAAAAATLASAAEGFSVEVSGQGRPMILIPGLACDSRVWQETVERYEDRYACHVLSVAGFAGSAPLSGDKSSLLATVQRELSAYIREQNLDQPIVVGHSLGGFLALSLASEQPDLCGPLVIVDSLPFLPAAMQPGATVEAMRPMATVQRDQMLNHSGGQSSAQTQAMLSTMITDPQRIQEAATMTDASDAATVAHAMYALQTTDLRKAVADIQSPVLVLGAWIAYRDFGATRESTESIFRSQYSALPNCKIEMADNARHFIMWDDPQFFFAQLDSFLPAHP